MNDEDRDEDEPVGEEIAAEQGSSTSFSRGLRSSNIKTRKKRPNAPCEMWFTYLCDGEYEFRTQAQAFSGDMRIAEKYVGSWKARARATTVVDTFLLPHQ